MARKKKDDGKNAEATSAGNDEKLMKSSLDLRDLVAGVREDLSELGSEIRSVLERQSLEAMSALNSSMDFIKRSDTTTADLLSQVSSLRDYVAKQQAQVKRLQDGYDWTILRNFCLRVIRCIDDIEKRMGSVDDDAASHREDLEMIHDQLVFALDGNGVEQFRPECGVPYSGLEKVAEVVGKDPLSDGGAPGHISRVVGSGYIVHVSQEQQRLIRPAKVILFEREPEGSDGIE